MTCIPRDETNSTSLAEKAKSEGKLAYFRHTKPPSQTVSVSDPRSDTTNSSEAVSAGSSGSEAEIGGDDSTGSQKLVVPLQ